MSRDQYNAGRGRKSGPVGTLTPPRMEAVMSATPSPAGQNPKPNPAQKKTTVAAKAAPTARVAPPKTTPTPGIVPARTPAKTTTTAAAAPRTTSSTVRKPIDQAALAAVREASTRTVKAPVELWKCNQCSAPLEKGCVATGLAEIIDGKLLCGVCLKRMRLDAAALRRRKVLSVCAVVLVVSVAVVAVVLQRSAQQQEIQQQVSELSAVGDKVSELLQKDQCLAALRQVRLLEDKAGKIDEAHAQQARTMLDDAKQKVEQWFQRTYGNLDASEKKILTNLLASYASDSERPMQILSVRLEHGRLALRVVGSTPAIDTREARDTEPPPAADVAISKDVRPRHALDEARHFLIYVFNSFAEVSLVEVQWLVQGKSEPEEFANFSANRRQLARLEEPTTDVRRLNERAELMQPQQP
ncbi:MAG TPA: hypothetical protein VEJ63_07665 [Planctomycetota bacterium]|nr:hypothetical protein [Planctomycetota bacterium]